MSPLLAALAVVALQTLSVSAQGTNATCLPSFGWATNSRGQSPCLQAAYLNGACLSDPQDAYVYSLPVDFHYRPPTAAIATPCQCSTVFYAMIGACAACQDRENLPWSAWESNCTAVYTGIWPVNIPPGTSIPAWAFLDVVTPDAFNATTAQRIASTDPAESSPAAAPPTSISFTPTASASASNDAPPTGPTSGSSSSSSSSHKSNVGPIVGGVVGGVGGAAILGGILAYLYIRHRRNQRNTAGTTLGSNTAYTPPNEHMGGAEPQMYQQTQPGYASVPPHSPMSPPPPTGALYNPDDPTTFPGASPAQSGTGYAPSQYTGQAQPMAYQHTPGRYTGAAEL